MPELYRDNYGLWITGKFGVHVLAIGSGSTEPMPPAPVFPGSPVANRPTRPIITEAFASFRKAA